LYASRDFGRACPFFRQIAQLSKPEPSVRGRLQGGPIKKKISPTCGERPNASLFGHLDLHRFNGFSRAFEVRQQLRAQLMAVRHSSAT
jgi:hypothetical protein